MKKILAAMLALLMLLPLAACKKPSGNDEPTPAPTEQQAALPTGETTDEPVQSDEPALTDEPAVTEEPTEEPAEVPTEEPTEEATAEPTPAPTPEPTDTPKPTAAPDAMIPEMIMGEDSVYLLYPNGELWAWGKNDSGQIGDNSTKDRRSPVKIMDGVRSVYTEERSVFAIKTDSSLWAWGWNAAGRLGVGSSDEVVKKPQKAAENVEKVLVDEGSARILHKDGTLDIAGSLKWGAESHNKPVQYMTGVADVGHKAALLKNGSLVAMIEGNTIDYSVEEFLDFAESYDVYYLKSDGIFWVARDAYDEAKLHYIDRDVRSFHCYPEELMGVTDWQYYYLKTNGELWYFRYDYEIEQPAKEKVLSKVRELVVGGYLYGYEPVPVMLAIKENGDLYSWTNEEYYIPARLAALGAETTQENEPFDVPRKVLSDVKAVFTNGISSYAIKSDSALYGCGLTEKGHYKGGIGDGSYETVKKFKKITKDVLKVYQILIYESIPEDSDEPSYDYATTRYAVKSDGSVWAWGSGENGLIGNGGTKRADSPVKIMDPKFN